MDPFHILPPSPIFISGLKSIFLSNSVLGRNGRGGFVHNLVKWKSLVVKMHIKYLPLLKWMYIFVKPFSPVIFKPYQSWSKPLISYLCLNCAKLELETDISMMLQTIQPTTKICTFQSQLRKHGIAVCWQINGKCSCNNLVKMI